MFLIDILSVYIHTSMYFIKYDIIYPISGLMLRDFFFLQSCTHCPDIDDRFKDLLSFEFAFSLVSDSRKVTIIADFV